MLPKSWLLLWKLLDLNNNLPCPSRNFEPPSPVSIVHYWTFPYGNVLCEKTCGLVGMWRILLKICWSALDQHGGKVNRQQTQRLSFIGGEGGEGRGGHWQWTQRLSFVGGEGGEGMGVNQQSSQRRSAEVEICRWEGRGGGRLTANSEVVICRWGGRGGEGRGVNWWSTWKGSMKTLEGLLLTMLILGGQSMVNFERIHKDFGRITSDNVDPGGLIDSQLGKDPQRLCKDYLWQC